MTPAAHSSRAAGALVVSFGSLARCRRVWARRRARRPRRDRSARRPSHVDRSSSTRGSRSAPTARVTAYTGKCELGQGIYTAQTQLVAEELSVPLDAREARSVRHAVTPGPGDDVGQPVDADELQRGQSRAGVRHGARGAACGSASERLGVPVDQLTVVDGVVGVQRRCVAKQVGYGELVGGRKFNLTVRRDGEAEGRRASGRCSARRCRASTWPAMATGAVRVRAQRARARHAARPRRAAAGGRRDARRASTRARCADFPGVVKVVVQKNFVGVVAEKPWQAMQAAQAAQGHVDAGRRAAEPARRSTTHLRSAEAVARRAAGELEGRGRRRWRRRATVVKATYLHPYQMHGSMGSVVRGGGRAAAARRRIWSPTQSAYPTRSGAAMLLGLPAEERARDLHARRRAVTGSTAPTRCRTTPRCCRRRWASRCACSCRARTRWPGRTTATRS